MRVHCSRRYLENTIKYYAFQPNHDTSAAIDQIVASAAVLNDVAYDVFHYRVLILHTTSSLQERTYKENYEGEP